MSSHDINGIVLKTIWNLFHNFADEELKSKFLIENIDNNDKANNDNPNKYNPNKDNPNNENINNPNNDFN